MITIIHPQEFQTSRWKNGGGVTHEILRDMDHQVWAWRFSLAEVSSDGPFSFFNGYSRILTVVQGQGLHLHTPQGVLAAQPLVPVAFDGALPVESTMVDGPIRDFNVIYDGAKVSAKVDVIHGPAEQNQEAGQTGVYALSDGITVGDTSLPQGAFAFGAGFRVTLPLNAQCLLVHLGKANGEG